MQEVRQQRLAGDKELYARRLELQRIEAQQKAEEATKRCVLPAANTGVGKTGM